MQITTQQYNTVIEGLKTQLELQAAMTREKIELLYRETKAYEDAVGKLTRFRELANKLRLATSNKQRAKIAADFDAETLHLVNAAHQED